MIKTLIRYTATALTCVILAVSIPFTSYADTTNEYQQQMEERKSLPIQSNEIANWPEGSPHQCIRKCPHCQLHLYCD